MLSTLFKQTLNAVTSKSNKLALIVRGDLRMSKGKTAAQCAHAAVLCYQQMDSDTDKHALRDAWCFNGQPKIVLRVDSYEEIVKLQQAAEALGVVAVVVHDAGRTQLKAGTATVLGIGPDTLEHIDKLVAHLKLL